MKKSLHEIVQRTCGRGSIERFEFTDLPGNVRVANDSVFKMRSVG